MRTWGSPSSYGYVDQEYPLAYYQTLFATTPGSAEMPSAARPFTQHVLETLRAQGVGLAGVVLHTGVSSLEVEAEEIETQPLYPEPFQVPAASVYLDRFLIIRSLDIAGSSHTNTLYLEFCRKSAEAV